VGSLTPHTPIGLQGLLRDSFTFTLLYLYEYWLWNLNTMQNQYTWTPDHCSNVLGYICSSCSLTAPVYCHVLNCEYVAKYKLPVSECLSKEHPRYLTGRPGDEKNSVWSRRTQKSGEEVLSVSAPRRIASRNVALIFLVRVEGSSSPIFRTQHVILGSVQFLQTATVVVTDTRRVFWKAVTELA
jgi:hypothetical protein